VPLITLHPEKLWTRAGLGTMAGVLMLISSVVLFSIAGKTRETMLQPASDGNTARPREGKQSEGQFLRGLIFCILCGVLNPLINFALAYGADIQAQAVKYGASSAAAPNAIWVVVANAGFIPNAIFSFYLLSAKSSWRLFPAASVSYWAVTPLMGLMWISGTVLYGAGSIFIGPLGPVIGWPLSMSAMILTATFWGCVSGEWKGVHGAPVRLMAVGLSILLGAIFVLALSARFE
jgi:L-rhamnose-H+ transport protein